MAGYFRTAILLAGLTALFIGIGYALGGQQGMVIAFLVACGTNLWSWWNSDRVVLSMHTRASLERFGAQAMIAGLFAATAIFTRRTFALYGAALLPFFVFDYYFYEVEPMLTEIGLLDAVGNAIMLFLCWLGWKRAPA